MFHGSPNVISSGKELRPVHPEAYDGYVFGTICASMAMWYAARFDRWLKNRDAERYYIYLVELDPETLTEDEAQASEGAVKAVSGTVSRLFDHRPWIAVPETIRRK
jgi:hypothetical protein